METVKTSTLDFISQQLDIVNDKVKFFLFR